MALEKIKDNLLKKYWLKIRAAIFQSFWMKNYDF